MHAPRLLVPSLSLALLACPSTDTPPQTQLGEVELAADLTLQVAERGSGDAVVIFLHGYTDSWFSFSEVLPLLPADVHAYALSQRGHGESSRPAEGYALADFAADVIAFMDAEGIERATLVGHSMGSLVAQRVAIDDAERVEGLVLIGSSAAGNNEVVLGLLDYVLTLEDPIDPTFVRDFQVSTLAQPVDDAFVDRVVEESLRVPAFVWKAALTGLSQADHTAELGMIAAPTLILWGDADTVFSSAEQDVLVQGIPDAELLVLPGYGHGVHWEDPQRTVDELLAFMAR